jgi:type VI secretion system protein ImpL
VWWVLSALVILIFWALKFILDLGWWIPITATAVVVVIGVALFILNRFRASRAATALERAIAQQGAQQALNARPERRAEIQELQKQVQSGINALKMSKLGAGRKSGAAALYSLPWYVIIGPPGAGKTTALKHSGLVFPYADPRGGGVRGVGGTRNCDWWFTNEGILLDTAGRYATEQDDHDEWIAFLQMLRRYRSKRPVNGILVAISVAELIDATEQQIEATGKKLRARIDEVMTQLHMVVPVYLLFTKCDLVAGFGEFFGDLRKSDRAQAWGTTLRLNHDKSNPGRIFETEFDTLVQQLHARALKRLAMERNREARERLFQFPLEFAGMRRNLAELIATIFMVNAFQGTPIFRGFYFTSGTQEGRPLDRVLARMGHAMGIRPPETAVQQVVESKSYFLHDVFMNVVFPDGDIAARSQSEIRRQKLLRLAVSAAALSLAAIVAAPAVVSFLNNRQFLKETEQYVQNAHTIQWGDGRPPQEKLDKLKPLLDRLIELDEHRETRPMGMGWTMYQGETIYRPAVTAYVKILQDGFVLPCKLRLEERLKVVTGNAYLRERTDLKTYLMMSDIEHLDVEWEAGKLTSLWAEILRPTSNLAEVDLKKMLVGHVAYYLLLLKEKKVLPLDPDAALVTKARTTLQDVPVQKRYFDLFVNSLSDEKYDEAGDSSLANRKYPPISLNDMFKTDRADVLKVLTSKRYAREKRWQEIEGPYTDKGHFAVLDNIAEGATLLEREQWVVPLKDSEKGDQIPTNLKRLAEDYDDRYIEEWNDFVADVQVSSPANVKEAIEAYNTLIKAEWPYLRILRFLEDHTQWKKERSLLDKKPVNKLLEDRINRRIQSETGLRIPVKIEALKSRVSRVPAAFRKTVEFGIPVDTRGGPISDTPLAKYILVLSALRDDMQKISDSTPNPDVRILGEKLADASQKADALLQPFDDRARTLVSPLLQNPLRVAQARPGLPAPGRLPQPMPPPGTLQPR